MRYIKTRDSLDWECSICLDVHVTSSLNEGGQGGYIMIKCSIGKVKTRQNRSPKKTRRLKDK